jgi:hypothetical protein
MKNYIYIIAVITLMSFKVYGSDGGSASEIKVTMPSGKEVYLSQEKVREWFQQELKTFAAPLVKINSLPKLFDFIIAAKKQDLLSDIVHSKITILIDQLNDAIRQEEQLMKLLGDYKNREKINYAKNKIHELQDVLDQE